MTNTARRLRELIVDGKYLYDAYVWRADEDPDGPWVP